MGFSCLGDDGVEHNGGDTWITANCYDCSCTARQELLVSYNFCIKDIKLIKINFRKHVEVESTPEKEKLLL